MTQTRRRWWTSAGLALVTLASFVVAVCLLQWFAERLISGRQTPDAAGSLNDARMSLIQLAGGLVLISGLVYTARTYALSRSTQRSERFTRAIEQLGNETSLGVRLGGIYALGMIAEEDRGFWDSIDQILIAFIREQGSAGSHVHPDVQASMNVLAKRGKRSEEEWEALDLRGAMLQGVYLAGQDFGRARLNGAQLDGANFTDATLISTQFEGASLTNAIFSKADCRRANFGVSDLTDAEFLGVRLDGATISADQLLSVKNPPNR